MELKKISRALISVSDKKNLGSLLKIFRCNDDWKKWIRIY